MLSSKSKQKELSQRELKSKQLIDYYNERLKQTVTLFYSEVGDDEENNEMVFAEFNLAWKRTAFAVNSTQKHTKINPFAFENQIEKYKQIALQRAIKQQENGEQQDNSPLRVER